MTPTCQQPHWRPHPASDSDATPSQPRSCFIAPLAISHSVDISTTFFHANTNSSPFACDFGRDTIIKKKTEGERERERVWVVKNEREVLKDNVAVFIVFRKYKGSDLKHG